MTQFDYLIYIVNFSRLPQNSSLACKGYDVVLYGARPHLKMSGMSYFIQRSSRDWLNWWRLNC